MLGRWRHGEHGWRRGDPAPSLELGGRWNGGRRATGRGGAGLMAWGARRIEGAGGAAAGFSHWSEAGRWRGSDGTRAERRGRRLGAGVALMAERELARRGGGALDLPWRGAATRGGGGDVAHDAAQLGDGMEAARARARLGRRTREGERGKRSLECF